MKDCVFCKIARGEIKAEKIYENEDFFSIPDANPVGEGHSLVISKKHYRTVLDLPDGNGSKFLDCVKKTAKKLMQRTKADGFNIINNNFRSAGQVVEHLHFHVIPRKKDDALKSSSLFS